MIQCDDSVLIYQPFLQGTELLFLLPNVLVPLLQLPSQSLELTCRLGCCFMCAIQRGFFLRQQSGSRSVGM